MKKYCTLIPILSLLPCSSEEKLVHIQNLFYAVIKRFQTIRWNMPNEIGSNIIRHGNLPFGRLKMI